MSLESTTVRPATAADIPAIHTLICDLAEFEELRHTVEATPEDLHQHLLGSNPAAEALIAEQAGGIVGFALYFRTFSTFLGRPGLYLEDIYVQPEHRSHGVGRLLLKAVAQQAVERNCGRLEWSVLHWNEPALRFYQLLGAKPLSDWTMYRLCGEELQQVAQMTIEVEK